MGIINQCVNNNTQENAMLLNVSDVLTSEGKVKSFSVPLELTGFNSRMGHFKVLEKTPVELTISNTGTGRARVEGSAVITFKTRCDRCLADVPTELSLKFERDIKSPDVVSNDEEDDEMPEMEGYQLNVETLVYDEILLNWPMKILCRPDCKGVCPVCGRNLNDGECGCDTFVPDPRMAALKDIFKFNQ